MPPLSPAQIRARLAANIRRRCERRGWSLTRLAELAGVARATVQHAAAGRASITVDTLARIADALDVDPARLLAPLE